MRYSCFVLYRDLKMISDPQIIKDAVSKVLEENPKELSAYKEVSRL